MRHVSGCCLLEVHDLLVEIVFAQCIEFGCIRRITIIVENRFSPMYMTFFLDVFRSQDILYRESRFMFQNIHFWSKPLYSVRTASNKIDWKLNCMYF